jgi:gentisate 1,2-dioxygenase
MLELGPRAIETFDRTAVHIAANAAWANPRSTASRILTVIEGRGTTQCDGREFDWAPGDMIAVPNWTEHRHRAAEDSVLVEVSDAPLMRALSWLRTA